MNKIEIMETINDVKTYESMIILTLQNDALRNYSETEIKKSLTNTLFRRTYMIETRAIYESYNHITDSLSTMIATSEESDIYDVFNSYLKISNNSEYADCEEYLADLLEFLKEVTEIIRYRITLVEEVKRGK